MIRTIVMATDFSPACDRALRLVAVLAPSLHARIVLVHVIEDPALVSFLGGITTSTGDAQSATAQAAEALEDMAELLRARGVEACVRAVVGAAADSLVGECRELGADLLVMGTTPGTELHNVLQGSVSHEVLAELGIPVLLVP